MVEVHRTQQSKYKWKKMKNIEDEYTHRNPYTTEKLNKFK